MARKREKTVRPLCTICGKNPVKRKGTGKDGLPYWGYRCYSCAKRPYKNHKGNICERCGFIPENPCQLDVHHKDGNHKNNEESNLQTLCTNCHRLLNQYAMGSVSDGSYEFLGKLD